MGFYSTWTVTDAATTRVEARRDAKHGDRVYVVAGDQGDITLGLSCDEADLLSLQLRAALVRLDTDKPDSASTFVEAGLPALRD